MDFVSVFQFWPLLLRGLAVTLELSAIAIVGGMIVGVLTGVGLASKNRYIRAPFLVYTAIFRGSPLLIQLFLIYFGIGYLGVNVPIFAAAGIGMVLYAGSYIGEIVRSGIEAVPAGQLEAAHSLGLTQFHSMARIVLPQTLQLVLPALIGFNVSLIKDSSIASIIGFVDLIREGQGIIALTNRPFETYLTVGLVYFCICFPISRIVNRIERKNRFS